MILAACAPPRSALPPTTPLSETSPSPSPSPSPTPTPAVPLSISSLPFHSGEAGLKYGAVTLGAKGGMAPYTWSATSLPAGLTLSPTGIVGGTPSSPGSFGFNVNVSDSEGGSASARASVTIYQALAMTETCAAKCVVGKGCSKCGSFGTVSKGLAPYTYKIVGGAIPKGMTWSGLALKGGFPTGSYAMSVQVTDKLGARVQVDASWSVYSPPSFLRGRASTDCVDSANPPSCSTTGWSYTGGNPSTPPKAVIVGYSQYCTFSCYPVPTAPPPQWKVTFGSGGVITFSAGGIACNTPGYEGYLTIDLVDTTKCASTSASNKLVLLVDISNNC